MQLKRTRIRAAQLHGALYAPDAPGPHPAIMVVGGSEGGAPERAAAALASEGFAALAVAYFGVASLPRELEEIPLEYFATAFAWLASHADVDSSALAVLGRSRGGELALLLGARYPELVKAVVAYVPSSVVWQSAASSQRMARAVAKSSWSAGGHGLPFVPSAEVGASDSVELARFVTGQPIAFRRHFERALAQRAAVADAAIAVERIAGPVLVISAGDDQLWPSQTFCELIIQRLDGHRHAFDHRHLCYPAAGHLLGIPGTMYGPHAPSFPSLIMGGSPAADVQASAVCWPAVVEFLHAARAPGARPGTHAR